MDSTELVWTAETRGFVSPKRRRDGAREPLPADGAAAELIRGIYKLRREDIEAGVLHVHPDQVALQREAIAYLDDERAPLSASVAAASSLLVLYELDPRSGATGEVLSAAFVDAWLERGGPAFAVEACAATALLGVRRHPLGRSLVLYRHAAMQAGDGPHEDVERRWKALRRRVATLPDDAYAIARDAASRLRAGAPLRLSVRLAHAFPNEAEWSADAARMVLAGNQGSLFRLVLCSLSDRALVEELVAKSDAREDLAAAAFDLADALGTDAEGALLSIADAAYRSYYAEAARLAAFTALALLPTPKVARWLVERFEDKNVRPHVTALFTRSPQLGLKTLAEVIASKKGNEQTSALLGAIVRASPTEAAEVLPELEAGPAKLVAELLAKSAVSKVADEGELPPVLVSPPWVAVKGKKKAKKPLVVLPLRLPPFEETVDGIAAKTAPVLSPAAMEVVSAFEARARTERVYFFHLQRVSDDAAYEIFRRVPPASWESYGLDTYIAEQLQRFGSLAIEPALRFAQNKPAEVARALVAADSPRLAPVMAHVFVKVKSTRRVAERWLVRHPRTAALGLLVDLFGIGVEPSVRANAGAALRFLGSRGQRAVIEEVARAYGDACFEALEGALSSDSLAEGAPSKPPRMPEWFDPASLPRPRLAGPSKTALPVEAVQRLGEMLAFTKQEEPYPGLEQVREACDAASLADFVWGLFEAWTLAGYPMDQKWAFFAVGHFGRDEHAHRIVPLLRGWPSEGAFPRALVGLDVLATMKSDVALMLLHGISEKVKSRPLLQRAKEKMESVAESLGLTAEELADRLVPTLGLDDDGARVLDFGARRFRVGFDEQLRPFVSELDGELAGGRAAGRVAELPKPGKQDTPELAAAAHVDWKALKKAAKIAATQQIARFELGMIGHRRWEPASFDAHLARHPLVKHLVRRLVFGVYDASERLVGSFRVAEDGSYATAEDDRFVMPEGARVGVVHPLELDPQTLQTWRTRMSDYQILQPFPQLDREVPRDVTLADVTRFKEVDSLKLLGLERRGWRRGPVGDGGVVSQLEKEAGALRASLTIDPGLYAGDPKLHPTQVPTELDFRERNERSEGSGKSGEGARRRIEAPDRIFLAEVAADLRAVGALG